MEGFEVEGGFLVVIMDFHCPASKIERGDGSGGKTDGILQVGKEDGEFPIGTAQSQGAQPNRSGLRGLEGDRGLRWAGSHEGFNGGKGGRRRTADEPVAWVVVMEGVGDSRCGINCRKASRREARCMDFQTKIGAIDGVS